MHFTADSIRCDILSVKAGLFCSILVCDVQRINTYFDLIFN